MKQKLALACTLIHRPRVLFLDEPTTGVDPVSRRDFWRILQALSLEGITIFMSTPYLDEAERCGQVALMSSGELLSVAAPDELKRSMPGTVIEIVCDRVRDAFSLLRKFPAVREVQAFGDRLNAIVDEPGRDLPVILSGLSGAGIIVRGRRIVPPSLENVFISLLTQRST
jgi:ABC-2 type transport system ATP-binding protein